MNTRVPQHILSIVRQHPWHAFVALVFVALAAAALAPAPRDYLALSTCYLQTTYSGRSECAYAVIQQRLVSGGPGAALRTFGIADRMFPYLNLDCHDGIHRVGDMLYYQIYAGSEEKITPDLFPPEALMCNHGFFHGVFEHLFQDRPDPQFIVDTCRPFEDRGDARKNATFYTCYHAAGHGLFRAQAEQVAEKDWGKPSAFVNPAAARCAELPGADALQKFNCTTGVESIFMQTSMLGEFGLSDPEWDHGFKICDQLDPSFHESCYYVRSLMLAQMTSGYQHAMDRCSGKPEPLYLQCMRGVVAGLVVNGMNAGAFAETLRMCELPEMVSRGDRDACYTQVVTQVGFEYLQDFVPDCQLMPEEYRSACTQAEL